jgi:hypothetical protein
VLTNFSSVCLRIHSAGFVVTRYFMRPVLVELRLECAFAWLGVGLLASCASAPPPKHDSLAFLASGHATLDDVQAHLGSHAVTFEHGHVLAYRLRRTSDGYDVVARTYDINGDVVWGVDWEGVDYDLVLAFDDDGILREHSLIAIHGASAAK